eukprot:TRINITY_DN7286_c0_g1_i2.p1 TRINITY_DN7286_c0_g1~~TRINITY_DN7286_c0_g1_i2.p1  ORF type:complete len:105 (-),score=7.02 TRINITY_DN7286_c0_g1_i2:14-328(-)
MYHREQTARDFVGETACEEFDMCEEFAACEKFGLHMTGFDVFMRCSCDAEFRSAVQAWKHKVPLNKLVPSLDVVAVSQAPSPESNPNSPLPVTATVVHYTTVKS